MVFIVFDGLDASGKDTQALRLSAFLLGQGRTVLIRSHPSGDNLLGIKAKQFLLQRGKGAHLAAALFYMLDVIHSLVRCYWQEYDCIIFVRYLMGTAYLPSPIDKFAYYFFARSVPRPNLMFFLDVTPQEAYSRILDSRKTRERFEGLDELSQTRIKALALALGDSWIVVDADRPVAEIEEGIRKSVLTQLRLA